MLSLLLCFGTAVGLSGCNENGFNLYFGIDKLPSTVDPQKAASYSELLTVRNCFRGLLKLDENDNAILDLAEYYETDDNKTKYTFKLKNNTWSNGEPVTAEDFVFAFTRAVDPATKSPYSELFKGIVGANEHLNGQTDFPFGVIAESDDTLTITLTKPDERFLSYLATSAFMPCNQTFFEQCKGKYGLGKNHIITNGNYNISAWSDNNYVKLTADDSNISEQTFYAKNVYLSVSSAGKTSIERIKDKEIDITVNDTDDYTVLNSQKYNVSVNYQKSYAICFNKSTDVGSNTMLTEAFAKSVHRELYSSKLNQRFLPSDCVLPKDSFLFNSKICELTSFPKYSYQYASEQSRELFLSAVSSLKNGKLPAINILAVDDPAATSILTEVISKWQKNLGAYVNIQTVASESSLFNTIKNGDFTIAFIPLSDEVPKTLNLFCSESSSGLSISNSEYDTLIKKLNATSDLETAKQIVIKATEILSKESAIIPIFSSPTAYIWNSEYKNVAFSDKYGTVDFSVIYK